MSDNKSLYDSSVPKRPLRQAGNLSYLDFIRVIGEIWHEMHPEIPILAAGVPTDGQYPCIVYSLGNRLAFKNENKPRLRERLVHHTDPSESLLIYGQKFINYIKFTVIDEVEPNGAQVAEELIEDFEDFMITYMDIFSKLGVNNLFYERRLPDDEESRIGEGVVKRSVVYQVILEKQIDVKVGNLESVWLNITVGSLEEADCDDDEKDPLKFGHNLLRSPE